MEDTKKYNKLDSRKYMIWMYTFIAFILLIILQLALGREELHIGELGIALTAISGVYYGANVVQKKTEVKNEIK